MIRPFQFLVPVRVLFLSLTDAALIFASYAAAGYYASQTGRVAFLLANDWPLLLFPCGAILIGYYFSGSYADLRTAGLTTLLQKLSQPIGLTLLAEALLNYLSVDWALPASIAIPGSVLALIADVVWRRLFVAAIRDAVAARRVLFLGTSPSVAQLCEHLNRHPELGIVPVGYLGDGPEQGRNEPERGSNGAERASNGAEQGGDAPALLGPVSSLVRNVDGYEPSWIVVADREKVQPAWTGEFLRLRFGGIGAADVAGFYETMLARVCLAEMGREDAVFDARLQPSTVKLNLQAMYSGLLAVLLAVPAVPAIAIVALLIKAVSPSEPVFLGERRIGKNDVPFNVYRLRMTYRDGEARRPFRLAWLARRIGLDALPLLWNVLRGEMSMVGPQPDRPEFAERLEESLPMSFQRRAVKPGVTGWAQTHDVGDDPMHDAARRLEYDLYYIKNLGIALDVLVLLRSLRQGRLFVL